MSLLSDAVTGTRQDWQEIDNRPDRRVRVEAPTSPPESPLRLARRHRNWTLERVVSEIDSHLGGSGVTASLLSAWERGTRRTSPRYRAALCAMYDLPPETLFAHQDHGRPTLAVVDADQGLTNPATGTPPQRWPLASPRRSSSASRSCWKSLSRPFEPLTPCMSLTSRQLTSQSVPTRCLLSALVSRQISMR